MNIIINGKASQLALPTSIHPYYTVQYETIVEMAGYEPQRVLTVTWCTRHSQGTLTAGQQCVLEEGMVFNVVNTSNA